MKKSQYYCMRFYVTYRCNSRCGYCNVWQDQRFWKEHELEPEDAKELIRQCYEAGVRYIDFTGGEPTLNKNLAELVAYAKSLGIKTEVTSNGIANRARLLEIAACADKFNLSLDTLRPDVYQTIRGVDCLKQVMEAVRDVEQVRRPKLMMVLSEDNAPELDQMICYAQERHTEVYLNPVFSYFDADSGRYTEDIIEQISAKTYERYTVVMLHFMEFYKNSGSDNRPLCSANIRTLTFGPSGALLLPCYHDMQESIPWTGSLRRMLASETFQKYAGKNDSAHCRHCTVIPYFGISFSYHLDQYFLIQSYSEKLNHLKRDFLNRMTEWKPDNENLLSQLQELLRIIRSLDITWHDRTWLYSANWTGQGYQTDIYRKTLTEEQYQSERKARDCWQLELVPHHGFDAVYETVYRKLYSFYQTGEDREEVLALFQDAAEFQLRWWKWFISIYMKVSVVCAFETEAVWICAYLNRLLAWGNRQGDEDIVRVAETLLKNCF